MLRTTDSHCHLDFPDFDDDRDAMLERARDIGVTRFLVPGVSRETWARLVRLTQKYESWQFALGLHPYFIKQHSLADLDALEAVLNMMLGSDAGSSGSEGKSVPDFYEIDPEDILKIADKFYGIGEIGLDATCTDLDKQKKLLQAQLDMAGKFQLPVILHHRKTLDMMVPMVKQAGVKQGIVHAFSGSLQQAEQWIDLGFKLGVGGVITYARAKKTRHAIAHVPPESIVFETDSPDMPVQGFQGQRNEPARLKHVWKAYDQLVGKG